MTITSRAVTSDSDWATRGLCREMDPDGFFVQGADQQRVKSLCQACPVRVECLADALDNRIEFGVWGGMTERERRRLLREHPDVESWLAVLDRARERTRRAC
ncbi:WhiB family transcriptional regulator [Brachybacterium huguangmaarense]